MKRFVLIFGVFILSFNLAFADNDFYDLDMRFIDNPFAGQKMITDKQYNDTLQKYQQNTQKKKTGGFWNWVFKHTLPKERQKDDSIENNSNFMSDEIKMQKELLSQKPVVTLSCKIKDDFGNIVDEGYYQVYFENSAIKIKQGHDLKGSFKAHPIKDNWIENKIIYARIVIENESFARIIYSDLKGTWEARAPLYN